MLMDEIVRVHARLLEGKVAVAIGVPPENIAAIYISAAAQRAARAATAIDHAICNTCGCGGVEREALSASARTP